MLMTTPEPETDAVLDAIHEHVAGVTPIATLTDRQIAEESLFWLREAGRAIAMLQQGGMGGLIKSVMTSKKG